MNRQKLIVLGLLLPFIAGTTVSLSRLASANEDERVCAEWQATKTMFLVREVKASGRTCEVGITIRGEPDGRARALVTIPVDRFSSGEAERDAEVVKLLAGDRKPAEIRFESDPLEPAQASKWTEISGSLDLNSGRFKTVFRLSGNQTESAMIQAEWKGRLTELSIEPPKVAGGAVARVHDSIALVFTVPRSVWTELLERSRAKPKAPAKN
jgi:polyisoprenoid-binding protein YceI